MIKDIEGSWRAEHRSTHSEVVAYKAHEPHEGCTGNLIVVKVTGKAETRQAIAELLARSPSMLALLEKALPIIEYEAEQRDFVPGAPFNEREGYWSEMRELSHEMAVEIDKAHGREVPEPIKDEMVNPDDPDQCPHGYGFVEYCPDCKGKGVSNVRS